VIRILIAEEMDVIRGALVALLSMEDGMEVVAELDRGDEIVPFALRTRPDVAVLDIDLPGLDGLTAAGQLHEQIPECHAPVLTGLNQRGNLLRALKLHVRGFIVKDAPAGTRRRDFLVRRPLLRWSGRPRVSMSRASLRGVTRAFWVQVRQGTGMC
jgi:two-component system, NarL family, response regulator DesR